MELRFLGAAFLAGIYVCLAVALTWVGLEMAETKVTPTHEGMVFR